MFHPSKYSTKSAGKSENDGSASCADWVGGSGAGEKVWQKLLPARKVCAVAKADLADTSKKSSTSRTWPLD
jgi:hypothetical protein